MPGGCSQCTDQCLPWLWRANANQILWRILWFAWYLPIWRVTLLSRPKEYARFIRLFFLTPRHYLEWFTFLQHRDLIKAADALKGWLCGGGQIWWHSTFLVFYHFLLARRAKKCGGFRNYCWFVYSHQRVSFYPGASSRCMRFSDYCGKAGLKRRDRVLDVIDIRFCRLLHRGNLGRDVSGINDCLAFNSLPLFLRLYTLWRHQNVPQFLPELRWANRPHLLISQRLYWVYLAKLELFDMHPVRLYRNFQSTRLMDRLICKL